MLPRGPHAHPPQAAPEAETRHAGPAHMRNLPEGVRASHHAGAAPGRSHHREEVQVHAVHIQH